MTQLSITIPPALQSWVDTRLAEGRYADAAEYFGDLVRRDQHAYLVEVTRVQALIDEGLASGVIERDALDVLDEIIAGTRQPHG